MTCSSHGNTFYFVCETVSSSSSAQSVGTRTLQPRVSSVEAPPPPRRRLLVTDVLWCGSRRGRAGLARVAVTERRSVITPTVGMSKHCYPNCEPPAIINGFGAARDGVPEQLREDPADAVTSKL